MLTRWNSRVWWNMANGEVLVWSATPQCGRKIAREWEKETKKLLIKQFNSSEIVAICGKMWLYWMPIVTIEMFSTLFQISVNKHMWWHRILQPLCVQFRRAKNVQTNFCSISNQLYTKKSENRAICFSLALFGCDFNSSYKFVTFTCAHFDRFNNNK